MALSNPALFRYGYEVDTTNQYLDFKAASLGPTLTALLTVGTYTLSQYLLQVASAMNIADPANVYTVTVDRTIGGGLQNRVTISTNGSFLSLLFGSGVHAATSPAPILGFASVDRTGATTYTGSANSGLTIQTFRPLYNYVDPTEEHKVFGAVNVSTNGDKEAIVYQIQMFSEGEIRFEPKSKVQTAWQDFFDWMIQQKPFELTPDFTANSIYSQLTLESSEKDSNGLGYRWKEQLPTFPGLYQTGKLVWRVIPVAANFIGG